MSTRKPSHPISPLYARYLTSAEKKSLRAIPANDVSSEINLLRVISAHFMKFQQSAPKDMGSLLQNLRTSTILGEQIAKLVRAQNTEYDPLAELQAEIRQAIAELDPYKDLD